MRKVEKSTIYQNYEKSEKSMRKAKHEKTNRSEKGNP